MSDWSDKATLKFLEAYKNEPCIWNPKDVYNKNRKKVSEAWMRLSAIMNKSVKELKNKKEILMVTFRRHLHKKKNSIRSTAGTDDILVYKPNWYAFELMESFLLPVYTSIEDMNTEMYTKRESSSKLNKTAEIEEEDGEDYDSEQQSTSSQTPKLVTCRRRPATDLPGWQMSSSFGQLSNILAEKQNEHPPPPKEEDDCELYSKLLAKKLRDLPPDDRQLLMYDIDTLFINRIKDRLNKRLTTSDPYSIPFPSYSIPLSNPSPTSERPLTSLTSYSEQEYDIEEKMVLN